MEAVAFNPEVQLSHDARAQLAHTMATPGFILVNKIMRAEVDKFIIRLIKVDETDENAVLASHRLSKAAAMFYQLVIDRLNSEVQQFMYEATEPSKPSDPTAGLIDLGESAPDIPDTDLLAGLEINEQLMEEELNSE